MTTIEMEATTLCSDWEYWEHLSAGELAEEVKSYAAPFLDDPVKRGSLYDLLNAKPLEALKDDVLPGGSAVLWAEKDETQHPGNAYKLRGAYWNLLTQLGMNPAIREAHAASSGNHGRGLALACQWINKQFGTDIQAVIHVAKGISPVKLQALLDSGARVVFSDTFEEAREETEALKQLPAEERSNLAVVEPYDDPRTMAGQATCGYEVVADLVGDLFTKEGVDLQRDEITLWVPGGGGGFSAGCAVALDHYRQLGYFGANVQVKVAQMEGCDALAREYRGDVPLTATTLDKTMDATAVAKGGVLTQRILADTRFVADIVSVPKGYVALAMEVLERKHGHSVEPAGALALAAAMWYEEMGSSQQGLSDARRVHITVTSGANVTDETLTHFASVASAFKFKRQSDAYAKRTVYGAHEVIARSEGGSALGHVVLLGGSTSWTNERSRIASQSPQPDQRRNRRSFQHALHSPQPALR